VQAIRAPFRPRQAEPPIEAPEITLSRSLGKRDAAKHFRQLAGSTMKTCICIPVPDRGLASFLRAHQERLPDSFAIFGDWPYWERDGRPVISSPLRAGMRLERTVPAAGRLARRLAAWQLQRYLQREKVDVVLSEWATTSVPLMEPCEKAGIPLVTQIHGADIHHHDNLETHRDSYRRLFERGAAFIYGARSMAVKLRELGVPEQKMHYNPCGVDVNAFAPCDPAANGPVFISLSRFADKKAPQLTLLAFERVLREVPDARYIAAGTGPLLESCQQMARALGISDRVDYQGFVPHEMTPAFLRQGRAFIQHSCTTSYGDAEGTVISVLEACACGLPVVGTRHGGLLDSVIPGETGFLVDEMDVEAMAKHMITLARDPMLAGGMGQKARARMEELFSMDRSITELHRILRETAAARRKLR
jgi:glycosyltransferase involved in cell wall biosynthesis